MNFFPTPYPGELLYSIICRYSIRSGNLKNIHTIEDLFSKRSCTAVVELPSGLKSLISNMPICSTYTSEYFINKHTLFPFYAAFIPPDRAEQIFSEMENGNSSKCYSKMGLTSGFIRLNQYIRFCTKCFEEDVEIYGEPYYHLNSQITGVFVCPKHQEPLYNSNVFIKGGNRQRFFPADYDNCIVYKKVNYSNDMMKKMLWMANDANELLQNNYKFRNPEWFKSQFRVKLIEKGYARMNNYVFQKKLREDFIDFYSEKYLMLMQSPINNDSKNWLTEMINKNSINTFTIRYLLLAKFLEIPLKELFSEKVGLCSNGENSKNSIEAYRNLWDERMIELISLNISIREIATILQSTPMTVRKRINELNIEHFWKDNGGGRYTQKKYTETDEFKNKRNITRKTWKKLLKDNPEKSSNQIRQNNQTAYRWLTKYDIDWLRKNARKNKNKQNVVDWNQRDKEILEKVQQVVGEMKDGKPQRITWTTIGSILGISGWLFKKRDKLPLTKKKIESNIEDLDEFHIRKIKWAIKELEVQGKNITKWNLLETAGVKIRYIKPILKDIEKILLEVGYCIEFLKDEN